MRAVLPSASTLAFARLGLACAIWAWPFVRGHGEVSAPGSDGWPAWAVAYGKEFWRIGPTRFGSDEPERSTPILSTPFDLDDIRERVSHAFQNHPPSSLPQLEAARYTARLGEEGLELFPHRPAGSSKRAWTNGAASSLVLPNLTQGWERHPSAPSTCDVVVGCRTLRIRQGDQTLYETSRPDLTWLVMGNTAQALLNHRLGILEHWEAREAGMELVWIFTQKPPALGPLFIETELSGLTYRGESETGQHFADSNGQLRLRVGRVTAVDSAGNQWAASTVVQQDRLLIEVPDEVLHQAVFPLAIDPLLSPEFGLDEPVFGPAAGDQTQPAIGTNGTDYLVVWADTRNALLPHIHETYGARVSAEGQILDPGGFLISRQNGLQYRIASNGKDYLVTWKHDRVRGVRVSAEGAVLDATELYLSPGWAHYGNHTLAGNGTDYLLVLTGRPRFDSPDDDLYAVRINSAGQMLDSQGIAVSAERGHQFLEPAAVSNGRDYLVVWHDGREFVSSNPAVFLYGARLRSDGTVLDPQGIRISRALTDYPSPLSASSDGNDYLVAWNSSPNQGSVLTARLSFEGKLSEPVSVASQGRLLTVTPSESRQYYVLWQSASAVHASEVSLNLAVGPTIDLPLEPETGWLGSHGKQSYLFVRSGVEPSFQRNYEILGTLLRGFPGNATKTNLIVSSTANRQIAPVIVSNGEHQLVVWQDNRASGGADMKLLAVRIDSEGRVLDPAAIRLANAPAFHGFGLAAQGRQWMAAWVQAQGAGLAGRDLLAARIDPSGSLLDQPPLVIASSGNHLFAPAVASNGTDYLVVWEDNPSPFGDHDIYGARISSRGGLLEPGIFPVSRAEKRQDWARAASDGQDYLVIWRDRRSGIEIDLYGARVTRLGEVRETNGIPISIAYKNGFSERDAMHDVGFNGSSYLVVWEDWRNFPQRFNPHNHADDANIYGTWVDRNGVVSHPSGFPICTQFGRQRAPAVAAQGPDFLPGDMLVVWEDARQGGLLGYDIYGARVSPAGSLLDGPGWQIFSGLSDQGAPAISYDKLGKFLVTCQSFQLGAERVAARHVSFLENILLRQNQVILTWPATAGKTYRVQFKNDLKETAWTDLTGDLTAAGPIVTASDEPTRPQRFYRLIQHR